MSDDTQPTVLVVDDEESVRETYELHLGDSYEVKTAHSGGAALVELGPDIDVVLLDRRMPGMSGDEVLEHIRDWNEHCWVVMVTAVDPDTDIVDMGFDEYLTKPVGRQELQETIDQLLLFDEYESLLTEYHTTTRTYATLRSHLEETGLSQNGELEKLQARRDEIRAELSRTIERFTDQEIADVFQEAHAVRE